MKKEYVQNYKLNQYEDESENGVFFGPYDARYIKQKEPTYQDNQLIEALPPIMNMDKVFKLMENIPIYSEQEREKDPLYRIHATSRLDNYIFPFFKHFEIEQNISIAIRTGYVNKKIFSPEHIMELRNLSKDMKSLQSKNNNYYDNQVNIASAQPANGFSIFGISGGGKSTAVDKILSSYPQYIIHKTDGENAILFHQLVWLKLDCSHDGSLKGLCQKFFDNVDMVLGTDYLKKYGFTRNSIESMIVAISHIALKHGLGLLIIDEIQHLRTLKNNANEKALNFFITMMNSIKLPTVFIGTYKAIEILSDDFRHTRRVTGTGLVEMNFLEKDEFELFIKDIWKFQWVKNKCELTDALIQTMYDCTMGIPDVIKKLYKVAQIQAIRSGDETITEDLIKKMLNEKFQFVKAVIDKVKAGKANEIYDDLRSPNLLKEFIENTEIELKSKEEARKYIESQERKEMIKETNIVSDLCIFMEGAGHKYNDVEKIAIRIVKKYGSSKEISFLRDELIKEIYLNLPSKQSKKTKCKKTTKTVKKDNSIKEKIVEDFLNENIKAYND